MIVVGALSGVTAAQAANKFKCELEANSTYGWIPPDLVLFYDEESGEAQAYDGVIHEVYGEPISARFEQRNNKSVQLKWVVKGIPLSNRRQKVTANYSVILKPRTGGITMTVYLQGSDINPPRGTGTCKPIK